MPSIARAYVDILPETGKFESLVESAVRRLKDPILTVQADIASAKAELDALTQPITALLNAMADTATAKAELDALVQPITTPLDVNADVAAAQAAIDGVTQPVTTPVDAVADTAAARAEIESLLGPWTADIVVRADTAGARADIESASKSADAPRPSGPSQSSGGGGSGADGLAAGAAMLGPQAAAAVGATIALAKGLGVAEDFRVAMRRVAVELELTDEQMKVIRQSTIDLGNDQTLGAMSAGDAADSYLALARAGLNLEQSQTAVKAALEFSIIAQKDAASGSELFGQALNALKVPGDQAVAFVNEMVMADQLAAGSMSDFGESVFRAAPAFTQVFGSKSRADLQASLASLSQVGVVGPKAGYAMGQLAQDVAGGTNSLKQAEEGLTKAARDRGVQIEKGATIFKNAQGNTRPYSEIIHNLNAALKDRSTAEYADLTSKLSDETKRALPQLMAQADVIDRNSASIKKAGEEQTLADEKAKAFAKTWDAITGALETLSIAVGSKLLPAFDSVGNGISKVASAVTGWLEGPGFTNAIATVEGLFAKIEAATGPAIAAIVNAINSIDFGAVAAKVEEIFGKIVTLGSAMLADITPVIDALGPLFSTAMELIGTVVSTAVTTVDTLVRMMITIWNKFGDDIARIIGGALNIVTGLFEVFSGVISGDWGKLWDGLQTIFSGAWTITKGLIDAAMKAVEIIINGAKTLINAAWKAVWDLVKTTFDATWAPVRTAIDVALAALNVALGVVEGPAKAVASAISSAFNGIKTVITEVGNAISGLAAQAKSAAGSIASGLLNAVPGGSIIKAGVNAFRNAEGSVITGPTLSWLGEGWLPEVVLPLTKPDRMRTLVADPMVYGPLLDAIRSVTTPADMFPEMFTAQVPVSVGGSSSDASLRAEVAALRAELAVRSSVTHITVPTAEHARIYAREHEAATMRRFTDRGGFRP